MKFDDFLKFEESLQDVADDVFSLDPQDQTILNIILNSGYSTPEHLFAVLVILTRSRPLQLAHVHCCFPLF